MSPFLEFEGKTVEKAVAKACTKLNISKDKLKYDVISYGSTGIFGLVGIKKSKIRVASPEPEAPKPVRRDADKDKNKNKDKSKDKDKDKSKDKDKDKDKSKDKDKDKDKSKDKDKDKSKDKDKDGHRSYNHSAVESEVSTPSSIVQEVFDAPEIDALSESPSELGREALQRIVDFITTDAEISVRETPERIFFNVEGGNTAVLIGKRGQTLEAIQYLVEKVINKRSTKRIRIQVDVEGYLDGRKAKLEGLAARLSEKAKRIGKPVTIGQLNAHDRRIVHIALKDDSNVRTQSMGDGFYRKLVIFPQRKFPRKKEIS